MLDVAAPAPRRRRSQAHPTISAALLASLVAGVAVTTVACRPAPALTPTRVAAAADLAAVFPEVAAAFTSATGEQVELTFGSSGLLARQLAEGAPFDVFAAADVSMVDRAVASGACRAETRAFYARGELSVWWRATLAVAPPASLSDLADPRFRHVAIANPESAPYGRAAKESLAASGTWPAVEDRIVYGENVQQALQFAASGNAEVAIIGRALASRAAGGSLPIDGSLHAPLRQALVACSNGPNPTAGQAFARFVVAPAGQEILRRHGFAPAQDLTPR